MTTVVDATDDGADADPGGRDPYAGDRIEVDDRAARLVSPAAWLGRAVAWLDDAASRLTYGR